MLEGGGPSSWDPVKTTLNQVAHTSNFAGQTRIVPGAPEMSLLMELATTRGNNRAMPPIATRTIDQPNVDLLREWIRRLGGVSDAGMDGGGAAPVEAGVVVDAGAPDAAALDAAEPDAAEPDAAAPDARADDAGPEDAEVDAGLENDAGLVEPLDAAEQVPDAVVEPGPDAGVVVEVPDAGVVVEEPDTGVVEVPDAGVSEVPVDVVDAGLVTEDPVIDPALAAPAPS
jgi:hypothetical protein